MGIKLSDGLHNMIRGALIPPVPGAPVPFAYPGMVSGGGSTIVDETGEWTWNEQLGCYVRPNPIHVYVNGQIVELMAYDLWTFNSNGTFDRVACRGGCERGTFAPCP